MTEEDYLKKTRRLCCIWTENEAVDPPGDDNNNAATDQFALKIFRGDKTGFQDRLNKLFPKTHITPPPASRGL